MTVIGLVGPQNRGIGAVDTFDKLIPENSEFRDFAMMIKEILNDNISVTFSDGPLDGHYQITPYSYHPSVARKLVSNSFFVLSQGLVSCIKCIHEEIDNNKNERIDK